MMRQKDSAGVERAARKRRKPQMEEDAGSAAPGKGQANAQGPVRRNRRAERVTQKREIFSQGIEELRKTLLELGVIDGRAKDIVITDVLDLAVQFIERSKDDQPLESSIPLDLIGDVILFVEIPSTMILKARMSTSSVLGQMKYEQQLLENFVASDDWDYVKDSLTWLRQSGIWRNITDIMVFSLIAKQRRVLCASSWLNCKQISQLVPGIFFMHAQHAKTGAYVPIVVYGVPCVSAVTHDLEYIVSYNLYRDEDGAPMTEGEYESHVLRSRLLKGNGLPMDTVDELVTLCQRLSIMEHEKDTPAPATEEELSEIVALRHKALLAELRKIRTTAISELPKPHLPSQPIKNAITDGLDILQSIEASEIEATFARVQDTRGHDLKPITSHLSEITVGVTDVPTTTSADPPKPVNFAHPDPPTPAGEIPEIPNSNTQTTWSTGSYQPLSQIPSESSLHMGALFWGNSESSGNLSGNMMNMMNTSQAMALHMYNAHLSHMVGILHQNPWLMIGQAGMHLPNQANPFDQGLDRTRSNSHFLSCTTDQLPRTNDVTTQASNHDLPSHNADSTPAANQDAERHADLHGDLLDWIDWELPH